MNIENELIIMLQKCI